MPSPARPRHPTVGAPLVGALPRAPTSSNRRGTPCGCPPPCARPRHPTVCAPLVGALPPWPPPRMPNPTLAAISFRPVCAPLVGALPLCALVCTTQRSSPFRPVCAPLVGALPSPVDGPLMYTTQRSLTYHSGRGTPRGCPPLPPVPSPLMGSILSKKRRHFPSCPAQARRCPYKNA